MHLLILKVFQTCFFLLLNTNEDIVKNVKDGSNSIKNIYYWSQWLPSLVTKKVEGYFTINSKGTAPKSHRVPPKQIWPHGTDPTVFVLRKQFCYMEMQWVQILLDQIVISPKKFTQNICHHLLSFNSNLYDDFQTCMMIFFGECW